MTTSPFHPSQVKPTKLECGSHIQASWSQKVDLGDVRIAADGKTLAAWLEMFRGEYGGRISDAASDYVPRPEAFRAIKARVNLSEYGPARLDE